MAKELAAYLEHSKVLRLGRFRKKAGSIEPAGGNSAGFLFLALGNIGFGFPRESSGATVQAISAGGPDPYAIGSVDFLILEELPRRTTFRRH